MKRVAYVAWSEVLVRCGEHALAEEVAKMAKDDEESVWKRRKGEQKAEKGEGETTHN